MTDISLMVHCLKLSQSLVCIIRQQSASFDQVKPTELMEKQVTSVGSSVNRGEDIKRESLPMMTTGTVGGCSRGRVVSSKRGMAAAWARGGSEEE